MRCFLTVLQRLGKQVVQGKQSVNQDQQLRLSDEAGMEPCRVRSLFLWRLHIPTFFFSKRMFERLGFEENTANGDATLMSPPTDLTDPDGLENRKKLLRAWVELNAYSYDFKRRHSECLLRRETTTAHRASQWLLSAINQQLRSFMSNWIVLASSIRTLSVLIPIRVSE